MFRPGDVSRKLAPGFRRTHDQASHLFRERREHLSHYVAKAEKKGRTKGEVDEIICWLTGYDQHALDDQLARGTNFEDFFAQTPRMNPSRSLITGLICGVRVEDVEEPTMREIRYLDKLVDELAKGKAMDKILRK
jgi:hypothetical protein